MTTNVCDLLIIGGGPAGLSAAINGASEGLRVTVLDSARRMGGQAVESKAIENYPGFINAITGDDLMLALTAQAHKFSANLVCPADAAILQQLSDGKLRVTTTDYREFVSRSVLLSIGLHYRTLDAVGVSPLLGRGVYYGMPSERFKRNGRCHVVIVGGANSAGQAAVHASNNPNMRVTLVARRDIRATMSSYLTDRLFARENVTIMANGFEVAQAHGISWLDGVRLRHTATGEQHLLDDATYMLVFIGALPRTLWLRNTLSLDERHFIRTWTDVVPCEGEPEPLPFETSMHGVFAAGDARLGSTKRVAAAVGEGAAALQMIHMYLARGTQ